MELMAWEGGERFNTGGIQEKKNGQPSVRSDLISCTEQRVGSFIGLFKLSCSVIL